MTDRLRVNGFRVPRRIARGRMQRPHPVTARREKRESYLKWLEHRNLEDTPSNFMKWVFRGSFSDFFPDQNALTRHLKWKAGPPPGRLLS